MLLTLKITNEAKSFITEKVQELENPVLVVFERVYRGWCGVERVTSVVPADLSQIPDKDPFTQKTMQDFQFPLYLQKELEHLWDSQTKIDVAGWSSFRRLVIVQA